MGVRAAGLCAAKVRTALPGRYGDGDGLYLLVRSNETAYWVFRYTRGKMREMGLGRARGRNIVTLAQARVLAADLYRRVRQGVDPLAAREADLNEARAAKQQAMIKARTSRHAAADFMASKGPEWLNAKHAKQWPNTLEAYVYPHVGDVPVQDIQTAHIESVLKPDLDNQD